MGRRRRWTLWLTDTSSPQISGAKEQRSSTPAHLASPTNLRQRRRPDKTPHGEKRVNRILTKYVDQFVIVYMDDILIYSTPSKSSSNT
jgi:hypothetical protein